MFVNRKRPSQTNDTRRPANYIEGGPSRLGIHDPRCPRSSFLVFLFSREKHTPPTTPTPSLPPGFSLTTRTVRLRCSAAKHPNQPANPTTQTRLSWRRCAVSCNRRRGPPRGRLDRRRRRGGRREGSGDRGARRLHLLLLLLPLDPTAPATCRYYCAACGGSIE